MNKLFRKNKVEKIIDRRTYVILTTINPNQYYDEGWSIYKISKKHKIDVYAYKVREYKTWKHNRLKQYKMKKMYDAL